MRRWLAGEDEISADLLDGGSDRLAGEQIVAQIDRAQMRDRRTVPRQPALRGVALAILLFRSVLRRDELGRQRQDLLVARCHDAGAEESMEVFRAAICSATALMAGQRHNRMGG